MIMKVKRVNAITKSILWTAITDTGDYSYLRTSHAYLCIFW